MTSVSEQSSDKSLIAEIEESRAREEQAFEDELKAVLSQSPSKLRVILNDYHKRAAARSAMLDVSSVPFGYFSSLDIGKTDKRPELAWHHACVRELNNIARLRRKGDIALARDMLIFKAREFNKLSRVNNA
jgi:hypothetical protein